MNIAIVGSRDFSNLELVKHFVEYLGKLVLAGENIWIISGGARGVDKTAETMASEMHIPISVFHPDWSNLGRRAGFERNTRVILEADIVVAFWNGQSSGTRDAIHKARINGKPTTIIREEHSIKDVESAIHELTL